MEQPCGGTRLPFFSLFHPVTAGVQAAPLPSWGEEVEVEPPVTTHGSCWAGEMGALGPVGLELLEFANSWCGVEQLVAALFLERSLPLTSRNKFKTNLTAQRCSWCSFSDCFPSLLLKQVMEVLITVPLYLML